MQGVRPTAEEQSAPAEVYANAGPAAAAALLNAVYACVRQR
jgi:hypothetical protein